MSSFGILLKLNLNRRLRISAVRGEKLWWKRLLDDIRVLVAAAVYGAVFFGAWKVSSKIADFGYGEILPVLSYLLSSIAALVFTIISINDFVSESSEAEYLLSVPASSFYHVLIIFLVLYVENLLLTAVFEIPAVMVYSRCTEVTGSFWGYWAWGLLITSLPASGVASLIGIVVILCLSTNPSSNQIQTVISLVCLTAITVFLFYLGFSLFNLGFEGGSQGIALVTDTLVKNYKLAAFYKTGILLQDGKWTLLFSFVSIVWYAFFLGIFGMSYRIIIYSVRSPKDYSLYEWKPLHQSELKKALFKRELDMFLRSKIYVKRTFYVLILLLTGSAALLIEGTEHLSAVKNAMPFLICIFISLANTTYCSLSMEGKKHWILETVPFDRNLIFNQKIKLNLIFTVPVCFISSNLLAAAFRTDFFMALNYIVFPLLWCFVSAWYGLQVDRKFADFTIDDEALVMNRSISFLLGYAAQVIVSVLLFAFFLVNRAA